MSQKYYTSEEVSAKYESLTLKQKNAVLYDAISYMQQYNGRSVFLCIAMAMGYDNFEGGLNTYTKN